MSLDRKCLEKGLEADPIGSHSSMRSRHFAGGSTKCNPTLPSSSTTITAQFFLDAMPTFAVGAAAEYRNEDEGWASRHPRRLAVTRAFRGI